MTDYPKTVPCPTCPWRRDSDPTGSAIPRFNIQLMRGLRNTVGPGDAFRPIMACHYSTECDERPCVGYLFRHGWSNLAVRVAIIQGRIDMGTLEARCAALDLWPTFHDMLAAYEAAT